MVRFVNPPRTLPMLIDQMFSRAPQSPLLYRWIDLPQIPEMFLKHLWISEDQRFFQHEGFDWKEMDLAVKDLVLKESLIFRYPKVLQEHLRHLRQTDPVVAERSLWPFRERRADLFDQHRQRPRRIDESHHCHLHGRD